MQKGYIEMKITCCMRLGGGGVCKRAFQRVLHWPYCHHTCTCTFCRSPNGKVVAQVSESLFQNRIKRGKKQSEIYTYYIA